MGNETGGDGSYPGPKCSPFSLCLQYAEGRGKGEVIKGGVEEKKRGGDGGNGKWFSQALALKVKKDR